MKETLITRINNVDITKTENDGTPLIPITHICKLLGIDASAQIAKLKNDKRFESVMVLSTMTAADGKQYLTLCLPVPFALLWLGNINPANVSEDARPAVIQYSVECASALYNHFVGVSHQQRMTNKAEIALLEDIADLTERSQSLKSELKEKKEQLAKLRAERLNDHPTLFT